MPTITPTISNSNKGVVVTSRLFYDEYTDTGGGGVPYLNGNVLDKMKVVTEFYVFNAFEDMQLVFDSGDKTITNGDTIDNTDFIALGLREGSTIAVEGTGSNDGTYTIASLTARQIVTVEALVDEAANEATIYDDTPITAIDYYYNIIENSERETYLSKTDRNAIQRFVFTGLDATDTVTVVPALVGSSSFGWVTNNLDDADTGETSEVNIVGLGITDHKQSFKLEQTFFVTPYWVREQLTNFQTDTPPDYYTGTKSLKHICKIDAKFDSTDPDIPYSGGVMNVNGLSSWYGENNIRTRVDYEILEITYANNLDASTLERLDIAVELVDVEIDIYSKSGQFDVANTKFVLEFFVMPDTGYINTDTTLRQNIFADRLFITIGGAATSGENDGTEYQVLKDIYATWTDANNAKINFTIDNAFLREYIKNNTTRYYAITVSTQDEDITTTRQSDRVTLIADFQNADYDQRNNLLLRVPKPESFLVYHHPNFTDNAVSYVYGMPGEPVFVTLPFQLETAAVDGVRPMLKKAGLQIVARKTGEDDFVIDQKVFGSEFTKRLCGVQEIDYSEERNFHTFDGDPYNKSSIERSLAFDSGTYKGYLIQHAFVIRYEDWLNIVPPPEEFQHPLYARCVGTTINQAWETITSDGWELMVKFIADVEGYDGFTTQFVGYTDFTVHIPTYNATTKYYNEVGIEVKGIVKNGRTKIVTTYTGDFELPREYDDYYAYIFVDLPDGSIYNRRFASTEANSEEDSPFEFANPYRDADSSKSSENLTLNVYGTTVIKVACWYDDSQKWGIQNDDVLVYAKMGFKKQGSGVGFSDGEQVGFGDGIGVQFRI